MIKTTFLVAGLALVAGASSPVLAGHDTVIGALLGAGAGAVIGHGVGGDRGAVIGGAVGAIAGASIANAERRHERPRDEAARAYYYDELPAAAAYYNPDQAPVFELYRRPAVVEQTSYPPSWRRHWQERCHREDRRDRDYRNDRYRERYELDNGYNWR